MAAAVAAKTVAAETTRASIEPRPTPGTKPLVVKRGAFFIRYFVPTVVKSFGPIATTTAFSGRR